MPSVMTDQVVMAPSPPPTPPKTTIKPKMARLQIPPDQESVQPTRLNQALPPIPSATSPTSPSTTANLALPPFQRPVRTSPVLSPAKPTRTQSHPTLTTLSRQLPPTVHEEHGTFTATELKSPVSPLYRQPTGGGAPSPIMERDSANSRYSMRRRASTSPSVVRRNSRPHNPDVAQDGTVDEEALRYAEEIRKKRESKRRWREAEDEDRVIMGNKVDIHHPNYITAYNMLTGLRVAVSRVSAKIDRPLTDEDFTFCQKFTFDYKGNELSPASKHDFRFKDYAPWVFRHLRSLFHLDPADYLISLTSKVLLSELGSPGKSGSFFYFSRDYRFVIKTLHHAEHKYLRKILRLYYEHVKANPNTLISQFYGLHRVKARGRKVHLVVINNVFPASKDIHKTFDLKGSTVGRDFDEGKLKENPRRPLKDLNWIRQDMHLELGPRKKELLLTQIKKDVELLASLNIMDYSLLLGIHYVQRGNAENIRSTTLSVYQPRAGLTRTLSKRKQLEALFSTEPRRLSVSTGAPVLPSKEFLERTYGAFTSEEGGFYATNSKDEPTGDIIYYFGVIDLLTTYGVKKHLETWWKSISHPRDQLSPVPPDEYAARFVKFIRASIRTGDEVTEEKPQEEPPQPMSPLTTIEEQEDRRILERAQEQLERERSSHGEKEEMDVGRATTLSPDIENPEQVLPNVTVQGSRDSRNDTESTVTEDVDKHVLANKDIVESPTEEVSDGALQEKTMSMVMGQHPRAETA